MKPEFSRSHPSVMVFVPVSLDYVRQLDRIAVFDYTDEVLRLAREAGFGIVIVEGGGVKKIIAIGRRSDLVGKVRAWKLRYTSRLDFEPETAVTVGGFFAHWAASRVDSGA